MSKRHHDRKARVQLGYMHRHLLWIQTQCFGVQ